jgi:hypothetical protein
MRGEPAPQAIVELASMAAEQDREAIRDTALGADNASDARAEGRWFPPRWFATGLFAGRRRRGDEDQSGVDRRAPPPDDY